MRSRNSTRKKSVSAGLKKSLPDYNQILSCKNNLNDNKWNAELSQSGWHASVCLWLLGSADLLPAEPVNPWRCVVTHILSPRSGRLQSPVSLLFVRWTSSHLAFVPSRVEAALMQRLTSQSVSVLIKICVVDYLYFGSWLEGAYHLPFTSRQPPLPLHARGKQESVNKADVLWSESALCWQLRGSTVLNTMFRIHITHRGLNPSIIRDLRLFGSQTVCAGCRTDTCWPLVYQADVVFLYSISSRAETANTRGTKQVKLTMNL